MCTVWLVCDMSVDYPCELSDKQILALSHRLNLTQITAAYTAGGPIGELMSQHLGVSVSHCTLLADDTDALEMAFQQLTTEYDQQHIVLFAPVTVTRALLTRLLGLPPAHAVRISQQTGAINRINVEPHRTVVACINDVCHLHA